MSVVDSQYKPPSWSSVTSHLGRMAEDGQRQRFEKLAAVQSVNLTLDIWSDQRMRAYLGITAHYVVHGMHEFSS